MNNEKYVLKVHSIWLTLKLMQTTRTFTVEFLSNVFNERVHCKNKIDEHFVLKKVAKEFLLLESAL